jgi:hypothetical protein
MTCINELKIRCRDDKTKLTLADVDVFKLNFGHLEVIVNIYKIKLTRVLPFALRQDGALAPSPPTPLPIIEGW